MIHNANSKRVEHLPRVVGEAGIPHQFAVGGDSVADYFPKITNLFGGVDELSFEFAELPNGWSSAVNDVTGAVKLSTQDMDVEMYMIDDYHFEFAPILNTRPPPSKKSWVFNLTGWEDFYFALQPDATQFPGAEIVNVGGIDYCLWTTSDGSSKKRPRDMCGGYEVLHKTKTYGDHKQHKVLNLPRPKFIGDDGVEAWGTAVIIDGEMTVHAPVGNWLSTAALPIVIDPIFGWSGIGTTDSTFGSNVNTEQDSAAYHTATTGDTLVSGHCYCYSASGASETLSMGVYDISGGGFPVNLLEGASSAFTNTSAAWNAVTFSTALVNGTVYGCTFHQNASSNFHYFYTDSMPNTTSYTLFAANPDPWSSSGNVPRVYSLYAEYSVSGGATPLSAFTPNTQISVRSH